MSCKCRGNGKSRKPELTQTRLEMCIYTTYYADDWTTRNRFVPRVLILWVFVETCSNRWFVGEKRANRCVQWRFDEYRYRGESRYF